jgi:preprotein translocase subunit SecE|tara:strand:- start:583 stop:954 length:372 start_codon:yes stop_codon:yes gene_type:complete
VSTNAENGAGSSLDWLKWLVVGSLLIAGIFGNWYYQGDFLLVRVVALLVAAALAGYIAVQTDRGMRIWNLMKEARVEVRRVVWPSNQETTQTTLIVIVIVIIFALIMWGLDSLLGWLVSSIIG